MKLITISGLDGSGKSTQIELLKEYYINQGKKVYYFHAVSFSLASRLSGKKTTSSSPAPAITKDNKFNVFLRKIFLIIDIYRFNQLYKKLKQEVDYILSDRYFYDQIINILFLEKKQNYREYWWIKRALSLIIKPDVAIYLKVPPQEIMNRQREIEQGLEYLEQKNKLYNDFSLKNYLTIINGEQDKNLVFESVLNQFN